MAPEALDWANRLQGKGLQASRIKINWSELMRFKRTFSDPVPKNNEKWFTQAGIEMFYGQARFTGPTAIQVESDGDTPSDTHVSQFTLSGEVSKLVEL